jgi:shikimate 5-dehydrogenase
MPLKEAIVPYLDHANSDVVNTVTFRNNETFGSNTDGPGALNAIEKYFSVRGKKIAILGAGGTAKAIASEATKRGATVLLFNRTKVRPLEELNDHNYDLLINTIPPPYVPPKLLHEGPVMDVVYHPRLTPLLQTAKGFRIFGDEMYVEQALLQQKEWAH